MTTGRGGTGIKYLGLVNGKKRWVARLYWLDSGTGEEREARRVYFATSKSLALQKRDELLEELTTGVVQSKVRFREAAAKWVESLTVFSSKCSGESRVGLINATFGDHFIDQITQQQLQVFLAGLTIGPRPIRTALIGIYRHSIMLGYVTANVAKLTVTPRRSTKDNELDDAPEKALTPQQVAAYFADLEVREPELYPLVFVQFMLGCRFSEVSALRHEDIDLTTGLVKIRRAQWRGAAGKPKAKYARKAALPVEAIEILKAHAKRMAYEQWPGWRELVFPRPPASRKRHSDFWANSTIDGKIRASFGRVGVPLAGCTTHAARHTNISIARSMERVNTELLREIVGHKSKQMNDMYNHPTDARVVAHGQSVGGAILAAKPAVKPAVAGPKKRKTPTKQAAKEHA